MFQQFLIYLKNLTLPICIVSYLKFLSAYMTHDVPRKYGYNANVKIPKFSPAYTQNK